MIPSLVSSYLPNQLRIGRESLVRCIEECGLGDCLRDEHAIKRVAMQRGKFGY
jgi:hypothetical protein